MVMLNLSDPIVLKFTFLNLFNMCFAETGLFGVPLSTLLDHDRKRIKHLKVPLMYSGIYVSLHIF